LSSSRKRPRTARRSQERADLKLAAQREKLFLLEPGGTPQRPLEITSPSLVESHARSLTCPRCDGPHEVDEHLAVTLDGVRLREAKLRCRQCGSRRSLWFRVLGNALN
jgi:hypothetical protein